jgi:hypothetical protein
MLISEHFQNQRKAYIELLKENQPKVISIIQEFVQKHIDEGLFVKDSGVKMFDYMNDNLSICFHHGGTGNCEKFFSIDYSFDKYSGEPLNSPPKFSAYDLDDYSSKKYEHASENIEYDR